MFRLPSIQTLAEQFQATVSRFAWVILFALGKSIFFIYLAETNFDLIARREWILRMVYITTLALPLALALALVAERRRWTAGRQLIGIVLLLAMMAGYYFSMRFETSQIDFYRFALFMIAAHLTVSFAAFIGFSESNGFWQFNKTLFLQFLNATLYSVTLYLGLLVAVETVRFLFDITYDFKIEADLAIVIFCLFHTIFFLSKIPPDLCKLETQDDYPGGLKIFTQYVLLPLEVVYLLILYAYTGKILIQWRLPDGGVTYLVLAFSVAGILALLLLFPLRESQKERWVRLFSKRFYLALLPLIILLFTGIFRRIQDYGITENRYIVAVLAIWLAGITAYFLLSKKDDIRWIPLTLAVICAVLPVGPWNIFAVSTTSQLNQFQQILHKYRLLDGNNKIAGNTAIPGEDYDQLISIINFFQNRGQAGLEPYFPTRKALPGEKEKSNSYKWEHFSAMQEHLSMHVKNKTALDESNTYYSFSSDLVAQPFSTTRIAGFENLVRFEINNFLTSEKKHETWRVTHEDSSHVIQVYREKMKIATFDLQKKIQELSIIYGKSSQEVPVDALVFNANANGIRIRVVLNSLSRNGKLYYGNGFLLY